MMNRSQQLLHFLGETTTLQYHSELNPKLWTEKGVLKPDVREHLMNIAIAWKKFAKLPPGSTTDLRITGGNCNYNYTPTSDIDLHWVMHYDALGTNHELIEQYLIDKKSLWKVQHELKIYDYDVEVYAQDVSDPMSIGQGFYSILHNRWIQKPERVEVNYDDPHVIRKVHHYMSYIDHLIATNAPDTTFNRLLLNLKKRRRYILDKVDDSNPNNAGEFSFENLMFKELRNRGYLDKAKDFVRQRLDKRFSLTNEEYPFVNRSTSVIALTDESLGIQLQYHKVLNPKLWTENERLRPEVREHLLRIANVWRDYAKIPSTEVKDIYILGGNAGFNYTPRSDIDLDLVIDKSRLGKDPDLMQKYLLSRKRLWQERNTHVRIYGYSIEPYVSFVGTQHFKNQGVYSLLHDMWIVKPIKVKVDLSDPHLRRKVDDYKHRIDSMISSNADDTAFKNLEDSLVAMRDSALHTGGEFAFENLVYKELRNEGYLDRVRKFISKRRDRDLSLFLKDRGKKTLE